MSEQLLKTLMILDSLTVDDVGESFVDGIANINASIDCSDDERVILTSLAIASQRVNMQYNAELARDVQGRELAALGVVQTLRQVYEDVEADEPSRLLAFALACELAAIVRIVEALSVNPSDGARLCLDGPLG